MYLWDDIWRYLKIFRAFFLCGSQWTHYTRPVYKCSNIPVKLFPFSPCGWITVVMQLVQWRCCFFFSPNRNFGFGANCILGLSIDICLKVPTAVSLSLQLFLAGNSCSCVSAVTLALCGRDTFVLLQFRSWEPESLFFPTRNKSKLAWNNINNETRARHGQCNAQTRQTRIECNRTKQHCRVHG